MKKQIITGVICGGIGLLVGGKLFKRKLYKLLNNEEFQKQMADKFVEELRNDFKTPVYKIEDLVFDTIEDADEVATNLNKIIGKYGYASVSDLYDLSGATSSYKDNNYGWTETVRYKIQPYKNGFILHIKKPELLK